jgi:hypothetical protein
VTCAMSILYVHICSSYYCRDERVKCWAGNEAEDLLVLVLGGGVPGKPLLVELDHHLDMVWGTQGAVISDG